MIIDTDAGSDDAIAILMLLRAESLRQLHLRIPQYEVIGITCSYGNTKEENVEVNVLKTLAIANRSDVSLFRSFRSMHFFLFQKYITRCTFILQSVHFG